MFLRILLKVIIFFDHRVELSSSSKH